MIYLNGEWMPIDQVRIPVLDRGFIFGDGVYEVIPSYSGHPFRLREHLVRLQSSLDAVRIANDTIYGLAGAVWSGDEARAQKVARRIRAGQVDVNGGAFNMLAPFGGFKQSGHGREAGVYGMEEFLEYKSLQLKA